MNLGSVYTSSFGTIFKDEIFIIFATRMTTGTIMMSRRVRLKKIPISSQIKCEIKTKPQGSDILPTQSAVEGKNPEAKYHWPVVKPCHLYNIPIVTQYLNLSLLSHLMFYMLGVYRECDKDCPGWLSKLPVWISRLTSWAFSSDIVRHDQMLTELFCVMASIYQTAIHLPTPHSIMIVIVFLKDPIVEGSQLHSRK